MSTNDRNLLIDMQSFVYAVLEDSAGEHELLNRAVWLYSKSRARLARPEPCLDHYLEWRASKEAANLEPKVEVMVYCQLFPGRVHDLLTELLA